MHLSGDNTNCFYIDIREHVLSLRSIHVCPDLALLNHGATTIYCHRASYMMHDVPADSACKKVHAAEVAPSRSHAAERHPTDQALKLLTCINIYSQNIFLLTGGKENNEHGKSLHTSDSSRI